jgi:broad specificity phosphatase PhoE
LGRIYLARHGEVEWNRENAYIGSTDLPLNQNGFAQATKLTEYLSDKRISAVHCSHLARSVQTAEVVASRLKMPIRTTAELAEVDYGEWEGVPESEACERDSEFFHVWRANPAEVRIPGGETFAELRDRAFPTFRRIAEAHATDNVLVVAHKSVNRVILCRILGIDINRYRQIGQGNACLNVIERREDGRFVVESINDQCFLLGGRLGFELT